VQCRPGCRAPGRAVPSLAAQSPAATPDLSRWEGRLVRETWTRENGLPVNSITSLLQTRDGYLWAGTFDGLVRFDGARFTVFNSSTNENLTRNRVVALRESRDGSLWFSTEGELVRFRHNAFHVFAAERGPTGGYVGWYEDRRGHVWVRTSSGLGRIEGDDFVMVVPGSPGSLVTAIIERRDGSLVVGTSGAGLYRLEERPGAPTMDAIPMAMLDSGRVRTLFEDPSGRLWVGMNNGVWTGRDSLTRLRSSVPLHEVVEFVYSAGANAVFAYSETAVAKITGDQVEAVDARSRVVFQGRPIAVDSGGAVWYATGSEVGRNGRSVQTLGAGPDGPLAATTITAMIVDREGSIWVGTRAAGLHRLKPASFTTLSEPEGLSDRNVYAVHQDHGGDIWVGTYGNGVNRIHHDGRIAQYTPARGYPDVIRSIWSDRSDRVWLGTAKGLFRCALPAMACAPDTIAPSGAYAYALFSDSRGRLWAGLTTGVMYLQDERWTVIPDLPAAGTVRTFAESGDGAIWMGTSGGGLMRYDDGAVTRISAADDGLPIDVVRALHVDADGWLWIGTEGRGIARLDPRAWNAGTGVTDRRIMSVRGPQGLFDEVIHAILEDDAGRMWMSTNRGIFWVAREELTAVVEGRLDHVQSIAYTEADGLRSREANGGTQPVAMRAADGRLWFATQDGVAVISPGSVASGSAPPAVVVERVAATDSAIVPGPGVSLAFGVNQRDLQIDYTALTFLEPANVRFRYRLEPYDAGWIEAGSRRSAFYTRVPPGRYTFRVMASNDPGVWAGEGAVVTLELTPRFRETRAALLLAVLVFVLTAAAIYRWRVSDLHRREQELSRLVEVRTAELRRNERQLEERNVQLATQADALAELHDARSRLFANLSHEFRTPLTLILGPLRGLRAGRHGTLPPAVREQHDLMLRNSQRLLRLINQILDLSRLQAGALTLDRRRGDLVAFARAGAMAFAPLAEQHGITLRFHGPPSEVECDFDPEQLEKVLFNLLSNAVKFTAHGGTVDVTVRDVGPHAEIVVQDTGLGIAPDDLPRIFDRFYQADASSTRRFTGTGIGLALARELVGLHGGEIHAESTPGVGSTFTVRIPRAGAMSVPVEGPASAREPGTQQSGTARVLVPDVDDAAGYAGPVDDDAEEDRTTVLVVDDNADVRSYVRSILTGTYAVIEARDGQEGLETTRSLLPDLVIADVMMPRLDGLAMGQALKSDPMTDAIPLVLLTARAEPEDHVAGLQTGADAYLVKPFDPGVLAACVANLLQQRRTLRERFRTGAAAPPATSGETPAPLDRRLRPLIEASLADADFGPEELARAAGLSYHQLYRALRDELGVTPSGFIRRVRSDCAAVLLRQGAGSVTEIAYSVGFESLSHFRRAFHERFDASPSKYLASAPPARAVR